MSAKVAVLMCACNSEPFIKDAIESILNQTYKHFEFIIVENGSIDRTWEIVNSYNDSRIKKFRTEIRQLPFNLNYGLLQTRAEYIARMDSDDIAYPNRLEKQIAYLEAHPDVVVLGTSFELFGEGVVNKVVTLPLTNERIRKRLPYFFTICHPSVMFKRETILKFGGYCHTMFCEDLDLWLRISRDKTLKFANMPEPLLKYRIHPAQSKGSKESYYSSVSVLLKEALIYKDLRCFIGALWALLKSVRSPNFLK